MIDAVMHFISNSGSCVAANRTSCGGSGGGCYCDLVCYSARDCCPDVAQTCQPRKLVLQVLKVSRVYHSENTAAMRQALQECSLK